jgi:hypothetical protein
MVVAIEAITDSELQQRLNSARSESISKTVLEETTKIRRGEFEGFATPSDNNKAQRNQEQ